MPLVQGSSQKAISENIRRLSHEIGRSPHVKSREQAIAIAEATARRGRAPGGPVNDINPPMGAGTSPAPVPVTVVNGNGSNGSSGVMPGVPGAAQTLGASQSGLAGPGAGQVGVPQNTAPTPAPSPMTGSPMGVAPPPSTPQGPLGGLGASFSNILSQLGPLGTAVQGGISQLPQFGPLGAAASKGLNSLGYAQGGVVPDLATGGFNVGHSPHLTPGFAEKALVRNEHRGLTGGMTKGPILSAVPGRTDAHKTHVPSGSYVIPADIVSGRGQGNTIAGAANLQKLFKMGPYGTSPSALKPKAMKMRADGGALPDTDEVPVRVNLAGGEIVVPPENLRTAVHPDLEQAHAIMDAWVLHERKLLRKTLAGLPGPVKE